MTIKYNCHLVQFSVLMFVIVACSGNYIITTPRKWLSGETVQICVFSVNSASTNNTVTVALESHDNTEIIPPRIISIPADKTEHCDKLTLPVLRLRKGRIKLSGHVGGQRINHWKKVKFAGQVTKIFVQTDKYLYKPGQDVQFRILTLSGPYLKISTNQYPLVWVETPTGSRIAQWINVDNTAGLIHKAFILSDEPEEGVYKIHVDSPDGGGSVTQTFKVEEYTLPRFEVTITPPKLIFGDDEEFTFTVCAKYTYGQPVKGNVSFQLDNNGWGSSRSRFRLKSRISGCEDFLVTAEDVSMNGQHYHAQSLSATATVTEDGTGEEFEASTSTQIHRSRYSFKLVGDEKFAKPGLPYTGKVKVELPDGSPAGEETLEVCAVGNCKNITTDLTGILTFVVPEYEDFSIRIKSIEGSRSRSSAGWTVTFPFSSRSRRIMHPAEFHHSVKRYFSPSHSSLVIHAPSTTLPCLQGESSTHLLPLLYAVANQTSAKITVQVVSRGQIQFSSTEEHQLVSTPLPLDGTLLAPLSHVSAGTVRGSINLSLTLPPTASPTAKVIVWLTRDDGEVVSDARHLTVDTCYTNPTSVTWSSSKSHPGDQVDVSIFSQPQSVCSLGVVDKSVELLSSTSDPLTVSGVFGVVEQAMVKSQDNPQVDDNEYCEKKIGTTRTAPGIDDSPGPERPRPVPIFYPGGGFYSDYVDALKMFDDAGLFIFSDLTVETRPCKQREIIPIFDRFAFSDVRIRGPVGAPGGALPGPGSVMFSIGQNNPPADTFPSSHVTEPSSPEPRTYFPETWLWQLSVLPESGVRSESVSLPHTITEWVGKAVCVHQDKGLGVSPAASITTFTPFFIDLTLPPSVKRGETLSVKISVFNYLDSDLPVKVILAASPEYDILDGPGNEVIGEEEANAGSTVSLVGAGQRRSCIAAQDKTVHTVRLRPKVLNDVNITVWAEVDELYPDVCGPEYVLSKRDHLVKPIKVDIEGYPKEKTWTKYICSKDIEENSDYLESWSITAPANIVPDSARGWVTAVGDLLGPTLENLGSLVRMPYGCGEQNMLNFAPNIFILQYLEASQQTTPEIAEKAIEYMKQGYQRELRYRHSVGSYSAFGSSDAEGSTWLTAFVLKSFAQARQFIQIDNGDINMSRDWLRRQQMENGCFESRGKVFHKGMKGGIDGEGSPVPLAAYILVSLLESGELPTSRTVSEAAFCLVADRTPDPYTLALKSYALSLAAAPEAGQVLQQLIALATETPTSMYWDLPASSGKSKGVAVEIAGYAILAMTTLDADNNQHKALKIVKWISSQRNGQGGFISTQDTVVALQALASFEAHQDKGNGTNLVVAVDVGPLHHNFHINQTNKLLLQSTPLPSVPTTVTLDMVGEGCALIQAVLRYNIPEDLPTAAFSLSVESSTRHDPLCLTKNLKVCASYQLPDNTSNMAVVEINLVSGYIPEKADLKRIVGYGTGLIKRYEVDGSLVTFYVDEFTRREICFDFRVIRQVDVENVKPGTVKVYDYYQPEYFSTQSYTLPAPEECLTGPEPEMEIEGIIVDPIVVEDYPEEGEGLNEEAIDEFLAAVDGMP